jgi:ERF superfamily
MNTSENIGELATALSAAQGEMSGASKDSDNPFFRSKYADLASVWDACRAPLSKHGLSIVQFPKTEYTGTPELYEWTSKAGEKRSGIRVFCTVSVLTRITHASGQFMEDTVSAMLPTADPQAVGSAITYLRRYSLQSVAGIAPEDDDGEAAQKGRPGSAPAPFKAAVPPGLENWLTDITAAADNGEAALRNAWKESPATFRDYMTKQDIARWAALKSRAIAADKKAVSA